MAALAILLQANNLSCYQSSDGFAYVVIRGGQAPYSVTWSNSDGDTISTNISARGLSAGEYSCVVTDSASASVSDTITLTEPDYAPPIDGLGMSRCELICFLKKAACSSGTLAYKYFVDKPSQGIDCKEKQQEIIWLTNAIDTLRGWYPEGTEIENLVTVDLEFTKPTMSCSIPHADATIEAWIISSVDGQIAHFEPLATTVNTSYNTTVLQYFYSYINSLSNYSASLDSNTLTIKACGEKYADSTFTIKILITDLTDCTITDPDWTVTGDGGSYEDEIDSVASTCETEEPCLEPEDVSTIVEKIKTIIADCNISQDISIDQLITE